MIDMYFPIFFESLWTASIIPGGSERTLFAMRAFGGFNMSLAFALSIAGALAGQAFNFCLGRLLLRLKKKEAWRLDDRTYDKIRHAFTKYLIFLLLLVWVPLVNFLTVASGFLGMRAHTAFVLIAAGLLCRAAFLML